MRRPRFVVAAMPAAAPTAASAADTPAKSPRNFASSTRAGAPAAVSRSAIQCAAWRSPSEPGGALDRRQRLDHLAQRRLRRSGAASSVSSELVVTGGEG